MTFTVFFKLSCNVRRRIAQSTDIRCIFQIIMQCEEADSTVDTVTKLKPTIPKNMASVPAEAKDLSLLQIVYPTQAPLPRVPAMG